MHRSDKFQETRTSFRFFFLLLQHMTLRRLLNMVQTFLSFYFSKWTKKPVHWGKPFGVSIEPTTACNLKCPECPSGLRAFTRSTGNLKTDFFRQTVDQLKRDTTYITFYFQGEPFINPAFLDMVAYASNEGMICATSTNGHFLTEEVCERIIESGLHHLIISVDGMTQEVYEQYRIAGNLETVLEGMRTMVKVKRKRRSIYPLISMQYLVVRPNEHQIDMARSVGAEIGVDRVLFKTAQIYDYKDGSDLIPTIDKYARYKEVSPGKWTIKNSLPNHCWRLWNDAVITWDGKVVPCCFDKDAKYVMGDLKEEKFEDIWNGTNYKSFRSSVLDSRASIDICQNCTEGCKVWE